MKKATVALRVSAVVCLALAAGAAGRALPIAVGALALMAALLLGFLAAAGATTQARQMRLGSGDEDDFLAANRSRSEGAALAGRVGPWSPLRRRVARRCFGHRLLVGDRVRVKSLQAIRATLDADGCLDGLPFMDEMAAHCGATYRVYRVLAKIYDYGRTRRMRRLDDCVLLVGLRCDGSAHGGCEASCYLIWKVQWLEEDGSDDWAAPTSAAGALRTAIEPAATYRCQYTQLGAASQPMRPLAVHGLFGPLVTGNVNAAAFRIALLTRIFNAMQSRRGGPSYPARPSSIYDKGLAGPTLQPGDWVRIKTPDELSRVLDANSKHRGLWFDRDMLKHAGRRYRVRGRIERIIDVKSGEMIAMKTPCIVLEGVHYSGEFQGFGEQHDFLYWREVWLKPAAPPAGGERWIAGDDALQPAEGMQ